MSESVRIVNCCISLQTGLSRFDCESVSDDVESDLNSSHYYTPSLAQRMHCHWHSPSQDVGNQSTMIQQTSSSDCLAPIRKSSLCSLTSQDSNIPQHTSRRLSRTLSLRSTADERSNSNMSRNHDSHYRTNHLLSCSIFGDQEGKHSNKNFTSYLHSKDYMPDTQESARNHTRKDYLPPTRRALSLLDSKGRTIVSMSTNRGNSATSDRDDYGHHSKPLNLDRVLPPLPYNAGSQGQRREAGRSSTSSRQCSMDVTGGPYGNHLNGSSHNLQHSSIQEEVAYDRPHHSSSLPSIAKTKEKKSVSSYGGKPSDKVNTELKISSDRGIDSFCSSSLNPKGISYASTMPSQLNNSKFQSVGNSSSILESLPGFRSKQDKLLRKSNTNATSSSGSNGYSQIPSLLNFRSPSANNYAVEKQKNKDYPVNVEEGANCVRKPRSSSLLRCTPDRSILSKFFKQGPEEKDVTHEGESASGDKDAAKKKRRISRFLRPDFFDTPREESIYAKEKDAKKAAEAENKLRLRRNSKKLVAEKNGSQSQLQKPMEIGLSLLGEEILKTDPVSASSYNINTDKDNINLMNSSRSEMQQTGEEKESGEQIKSANDMREKPDNIKKPEKKCLAFEKQPNNVTNKSRFLHSLEKRLEKFRSSVDSTPSANGCGKSRVDKAICSLREQSLTPRSGDVITSESHLLKRAVSVSDCCTVESTSKSNVPSMKESASSKLGNKVTSVLGLFRKLEDAPIKTHQSSSPRPSVLSRLKRTQSVYGGSHSDSVLLEPGGLEFRSVPSLHLKKTNSNSSVVKKKTLERDGTIQKEDLETNKIIETQLQDPGLKKLENKTTRHTAELTTDNMLGSETTLHNSNIAHDRNVLEGSLATKQQESSVSKLLKRSSIKSKTKNTIEAGSKAQSKNDSDVDSCTRSASVVEQGKSSEDQADIRSELEGSVKSVEPGSHTGLKGVIPDNVMKVPDAADTSVVKKFEMATNTNECIRLMTQEGETGNSIDNLDGNKNDYVRRKSTGEVSCNTCADARKAGELKSCTVSEVPPTMDNAFDNSPVDDYSLNDDEVKFANVKRLDSCLYPANDSSVLSPADESESFDSWSVCSDFEGHEFPSSPVPLPGDDVEESVGDRIRRKSFYSRFNDIKKKHKKPSLSSIGSLSFSYRDPSSVSFLHPSRNFIRKKDHPVDCLLHSSHSVYYPLKSHRSQSLYAQNDHDDRLPPCSRKSPVPSRLQYNSHAESNVKPLVTKNVTRDRNGNVDDFSLIDKSDMWDDSQKASVSVDEVLQTTSTVRKNVPLLGGSVETLRMPRHFNHNVNFSLLPYQSLYSDTMIKGSDSHLSRSNESGIGATIPKSCLPAVLDRHLSLAPRFVSNNSSVAVTSCPGSAVRSASVTGETLPLHEKYKR